MTYESRHRFRWAAGFPLRPGLDIMSRRGLLLLIAECSLSGSYYESQERLAERAGVSVRGVQKTLAKLCAEGALTAHRRGVKRTTRYILMRLDEVAKHGDFLTVETNHSSPQTTKSPPLETNHSSPRNAFETNHSSYNAVKTYAVNPLYPPLKPEPENEPGTITPTARRLDQYLSRETGRPLPESWVSYPDLQQLVAPLHFPTLGACLMEMLEGSGGSLPNPEDFFENYDAKKAAASTRERERKKKDRKNKRKAE